MTEKQKPIQVVVLKGAGARSSEISPYSEILKSREVLKSRDAPVGERLGEQPFDYYEPPYDPQDLVDLMLVNITHSRCVKAKAADAAGMGFKVVSTNKEEEPNSEDVKRITAWAKHLHKELDLNGILEELTKDRESIGWGCLEVLRNKKGEVSKLSPIPSSSIRVLKSPDAGNAKYVQIVTESENVFFQEFPDKFGEEGKPNFVDAIDGKTPRHSIEDSANELIFWKKPHVSATKWYGIPDIIPASGDVAAVRKIRDRFLAFFDNNCIPRNAIVLTGAEASAEMLKSITDFFTVNFKHDPHKTLILASEDPDFSATFNQVEATQLEADYRDTRKDLRDFIRLAHGIPPAILGIEGGTSGGAGSGLSQAELYVNRIVAPTQRGLHKILDNLLEFGLGIITARIELEAPDIRDLNLEMRRDTQYISHGVWSINEVRFKQGKARITGGDKHHIWSRRTAPQVVGLDTGEEGANTGAGTESEGGSGGGAVSDMNRA